MSNIIDVSSLKELKGQLFDCVVVNSYFLKEDINNIDVINQEDSYIIELNKLVEESSKHLKLGGLLFVYGLPRVLPFVGDMLNGSTIDDSRFLFKYWIALEFSGIKSHILASSHIGLLMYLKTKSIDNPNPFTVNFKTVRIPYRKCTACGNITKDWGGKKHLMNPNGTSISDVWSDIKPQFQNNTIPSEFINRIYDLINEGNSKLLLVNQKKTKLNKKHKESINNFIPLIDNDNLPINQVIHRDSITLMKDLHNQYPEGIVDLAFADPPYNLAKDYNEYEDEKAHHDYVHWCNEWLDGMYNILKPGGALFVLNIPKWAIDHAKHLLPKMYLQHWIVWDALSTPAGKLLPAHYSLLYFTKPGGIPKSNYLQFKGLDSDIYCLRNSCIKSRKLLGNDKKDILTDIWKDVHRIKHKKDRDQHPCQLPMKLMNRIIQLFTNEGDLVYDPFAGSGTTAISAKMLKRNFIISDVDEKYVHISNNNLDNLREDVLGDFYYERVSTIKKNTNPVPKKVFEERYINLSKEHNKVLSDLELKELDNELYKMLELYNGNFKKLQTFCKRMMEAEFTFA